MAKSIKLNLFFNILLNISKIIFPLITAPYVSRVLEPDGVGIFNFAGTYANYFTLFAALGIPMYAVREIAKIRESVKDQENFLSEIMSLSLFTTIACTAIFVTTIFLIPQLSNDFLIFLLSGITLYLVPVTIDWFYAGREEFGFITYRSLILRVLGIALLFLLVKDKSDLIVYVLINALINVINIIWNYIRLLSSGIRPHFTLNFRHHFKPLLLLFASSVAISIYTILDTIMLGFISDYEQVGFYNNASHISKLLLPITTSLAAVAMPRLSYYTKTNDWNNIRSLLNKSLSIVAFLCFPVAFGVIAIAPTFVPLFFGELFQGAVLPLQIVVGIVIAISFNNLMGVQIMIGLGYDKLFLYAVLVGTFSNFVSNLILIPLLGATGAAISSVLAETLILIVEIVIVHKLTPIRFDNIKEVLISAIVALGFFPIMLILSQSFSGWILVIFFIIIATTYYMLLQYFFKNSSLEIVKNLVLAKIRK